MASSIQQQQNNKNDIFIPTGFLPGKTIFFEIDKNREELASWHGNSCISGKAIVYDC